MYLAAMLVMVSPHVGYGELVSFSQLGGLVLRTIVVFVGPVGPAVAAEVVPEVLDAVEFRRVR